MFILTARLTARTTLNLPLPTITTRKVLTESSLPSMVKASAVGYYGPHGDEWVDESVGAGDDFSASLSSFSFILNISIVVTSQTFLSHKKV